MSTFKASGFFFFKVGRVSPAPLFFRLFLNVSPGEHVQAHRPASLLLSFLKNCSAFFGAHDFFLDDTQPHQPQTKM